MNDIEKFNKMISEGLIIRPLNSGLHVVSANMKSIENKEQAKREGIVIKSPQSPKIKTIGQIIPQSNTISPISTKSPISPKSPISTKSPQKKSDVSKNKKNKKNKDNNDNNDSDEWKINVKNEANDIIKKISNFINGFAIFRNETSQAINIDEQRNILKKAEQIHIAAINQLNPTAAQLDAQQQIYGYIGEIKNMVNDLIAFEKEFTNAWHMYKTIGDKINPIMTKLTENIKLNEKTAAQGTLNALANIINVDTEIDFVKYKYETIQEFPNKISIASHHIDEQNKLINGAVIGGNRGRNDVDYHYKYLKYKKKYYETK